ncbi:MAG: hypothetical protein ACI9IJ_002330, partial [Psychromonas sp.]
NNCRPDCYFKKKKMVLKIIFINILWKNNAIR